MLQLEHHALARGQLVERPRNLTAQFAPHQVAFRIRSAAAVGNLCQNVEDFAINILGDRRVFFANLLLSNVVETNVRDNAVNPRIERTLEAEAPDVSIGLEERVLIN